MKVKNYNKGNYLYAFDCVIDGEIELTAKEWDKARRYLLGVKIDSFWRQLLLEDLNRPDRNLPDKPHLFWRNVRTTYTAKLFKHFNLPRYKKQNYVIKVIK